MASTTNRAGGTMPTGARCWRSASPVNTIYHFDQADVIVSLDADFLACGPGNLRLRPPVRRQAPRADQRHAHAATQGRLAGRLSGRADSRASESIGCVLRPKIAGRSFCRRKCRRKESRPSETTHESAVRGRARAHRPPAAWRIIASCVRASEVEAGPGIWRRRSAWAAQHPAERLKKSPPSRTILQAHKGACVVVAGDHQSARGPRSGARHERRARQRRQNRNVHRPHRRKSGRSARFACANWSPT